MAIITLKVVTEPYNNSKHLLNTDCSFQSFSISGKRFKHSQMDAESAVYNEAF